jgi:hypothetical protein
MVRAQYHNAGWVGLYIFTLLISGCVSVSSQYEIELGDEALVSENGAAAVSHKRGDILSLSNKSYAILEAPGKTGFIIPPREATARIKLNFRKEKSSTISDAKFDERKFNEVLLEVNRIQVLISRGANQEAFAKSDVLTRVYPDIALFEILKANCLLLMGNNKRAKSILSDVLAEYPENIEAKGLLGSIDDSGHSPRKGKTP